MAVALGPRKQTQTKPKNVLPRHHHHRKQAIHLVVIIINGTRPLVAIHSSTSTATVVAIAQRPGRPGLPEGVISNCSTATEFHTRLRSDS